MSEHQAVDSKGESNQVLQLHSSGNTINITEEDTREATHDYQQHEISDTLGVAAVGQLITGYRESAAFLLRSADELLEQTRKLDLYQKKALHVALNFAMDILISRKGKIPYPKAPLMIIHGGAGSGKSTLIHTLSQQ